MFSSYYILQKGAAAKRETEKANMMNMMSKHVKIEVSEVESNSSDQSSSSENEDVIEEAGSSEEQSSSSSDSDKKFKTLPKKANATPMKKISHAFDRRASIWNQIQDEEVFVVINLQGIFILENSKRERIVTHIDY